MQKYTSHPHDAILFGVGFSLDEGMTIDALAPGCSADRSGSCQVGDQVVSVDGQSELSAAEAKDLILGRQGTYTTISFRRPEGVNVRTFKVQLMRGSADYIFLVECLRGLEHQITDLQAENEELRNSGPAPASNGPQASDGVQQQLVDLQAENDWLREKHRAEIGELLSRIEDIEAREQMHSDMRSVGISAMSSPRESFKIEKQRAQRSAPPPAVSPQQSQPRKQRSAALPSQPEMRTQDDDVPLVNMDEVEFFNNSQEGRAQQRLPEAQRSGPFSAQKPWTSPPVRFSPDSKQGTSPTRVPYATSAPRPRGPPGFGSPYMGPSTRYQMIAQESSSRCSGLPISLCSACHKK